MSGRLTISLTTTGRRSGQPRTATLYAFRDGGSLVVVGSRGGAPHDPAWVHNLRSTPRAVVRRGQTEQPVVASEVLDGGERDRLWQLVTRAFPLYATYERRTTRRIPLFVLEPAGEAT